MKVNICFGKVTAINNLYCPLLWRNLRPRFARSASIYQFISWQRYLWIMKIYGNIQGVYFMIRQPHLRNSLVKDHIQRQYQTSPHNLELNWPKTISLVEKYRSVWKDKEEYGNTGACSKIRNHNFRTITKYLIFKQFLFTI